MFVPVVRRAVHFRVVVQSTFRRYLHHPERIARPRSTRASVRPRRQAHASRWGMALDGLHLRPRIAQVHLILQTRQCPGIAIGIGTIIPLATIATDSGCAQNTLDKCRSFFQKKWPRPAQPSLRLATIELGNTCGVLQYLTSWRRGSAVHGGVDLLRLTGNGEVQQLRVLRREGCFMKTGRLRRYGLGSGPANLARRAP